METEWRVLSASAVTIACSRPHPGLKKNPSKQATGASMKSLCALSLLLLASNVFAQNRFVYLNNQNQPNDITAWQIGANGSLTALPFSPIATGGNGAQGPIESMAIVHTHNGAILYAANGGDPSISALTINPTTGNLTPIANSPFALKDSSGTWDMAASPDNHFLFVANGSDTTIHVFAIAAASGALTEVADSPFQAGANITGLYVTANNKYLVTAASSIDAVEVFAISGTGAIAQVTGSPFAANASTSDVRSNCASDRVFSADNGSDLIDAYSMSSDGALKPVPGSPFYNGATGNGPNSFDLALAPNSRFLFTTDSFSEGISSFAIAGDGALSLLPGSPFDTDSWEGGTAITAKGDFLYSVQFSSGTVDGRAIAADGTLTAVPGTPFGPGQIPYGGEPNSVISYPPPACPSVAAE
jgi:6-phosphogluconolactonase